MILDLRLPPLCEAGVAHEHSTLAFEDRLLFILFAHANLALRHFLDHPLEHRSLRLPSMRSGQVAKVQSWAWKQSGPCLLLLLLLVSHLNEVLIIVSNSECN